MARLTIKSVPALDGYPLEVAYYEPYRRFHYEFVNVLNSGAGIPKSFYESFASWLADEGLPTFTYDYRGIGGSRGDSIRNLRATIADWGSKDCAGLIGHVARLHPGAKINVIGHSIGGIVTGFVTAGTKIDRLLLISPHTGYLGDYAQGSKWKMFSTWHLLMPAITRLAGYFPGRALGFPEDLPYGVAMEWGKRRFRASVRFDDRYEGLEQVSADSALVLRPKDDLFATNSAMHRVRAKFSRTRFVDVTLDVEPQASDAIGHLGFFKRRNREQLWPIALRWLASGEFGLGVR